MRIRLHMSAALLALAVSASGAQAAQPVIVGPYPLLKTAVYDLDYAVSTAAAPGLLPSTSDTMVSIGLPTGASAAEAQCQAQVDWFDWDGFPAGLSGPGFLSAGVANTLLPGQTLEYTTSLNPANP